MQQKNAVLVSINKEFKKKNLSKPKLLNSIVSRQTLVRELMFRCACGVK